MVGGWTYGDLGSCFCFPDLIGCGVAERPDAHKLFDFSGPVVVFELCLLCGQLKSDPGSKQCKLGTRWDEKKWESNAQVRTAIWFRIGGRLTRSQNVRTTSVPPACGVPGAVADAFRATLGKHVCEV